MADVTDHPKYLDIKADIEAITAKLDDMASHTKDPYWASSARQHLLNFSAAYRKAFHDLPASEKTVLKDLF